MWPTSRLGVVSAVSYDRGNPGFYVGKQSKEKKIPVKKNLKNLQSKKRVALKNFCKCDLVAKLGAGKFGSRKGKFCTSEIW